MLKSYLQSFRGHRDLWKPFIIDAVTLPIIVFLWLGLGKILNKLAYSLSQGKSLEELKLALLSSPEAAQSFVTTSKYFAVVLIGGTLIVIILTLFIFSLAQASIWSIKFDKKKYWRWNILNLLLLPIVLVYILIYTLINVLLNFVITSVITRSIINGLFLIVLLMFIFTVYHSFARTYQVSPALSYTFKIIKQKFRYYLVAFILIFLTGLVLSLLISFIKKQFYWQIIGLPKGLTLPVELAILLIYIAWIRFYVSKI